MKKLIIGLVAVGIATSSLTMAHAEDDTLGRFPFQVQAAGPGAGAVAPSASTEAPRGRASGALGFDSGARGSVRDIIARHAAANGVPFALADAVVRIESRYNPRVSNGGAMGLMQIKPATARGVGFAGSASSLLHAETNVTFGMKYLAQAYRLSGGDVCGTVMRYQSGTYSNHMSAANRVYCSKARAIMAQN